MSKKKKQESVSLAHLVAQGMLERKAEDITIMDLRKIKNASADFFVVCSANSDTQADAIADSVESFVYKGNALDPLHKEGKENKEWILLDYFDVVAHIFKKSRREYYSLETLWGDAEFETIAEEHNHSN